MAKNEHDRGSHEERSQDPLVERLRPDPSQPPQVALTFAGLLGDSDRPGFRRLYFTRDLDYYAEFRTEDVLDAVSIPPEQSPFIGDEATRLTLKRDGTIEYTRVRLPRPIDEFDLDVRLGRSWGRVAPAEGDFTMGGPECEPPPTGECEPPPATDFTCLRKCVPETSPTWCGRPGSTCLEVCDATPFFCRTQNQATCRTCGQATCRTCQGTCQTCQTCAGQATCRTCETCGPQICR